MKTPLWLLGFAGALVLMSAVAWLNDAASLRWVTLLGAGAGFVLLLVAVGMMSRENRLRRLAGEALLRSFNERLEELVAERTNQLAEADRRHRTLLRNLPGMAYRCLNDRAWTMEFISDGSRALLGLAPEELTSGRISYKSLIHPNDGERVWEEVQARVAARRGFEVEYRVRHADGTWRCVWEKGQAVTSDSGGLVALEGFVTDITVRKQAELEIERLALVARETDNGVTLADAGGRIEWVNEGFVRMTGYTLQEVRGRKPGAILQGPETNPETIRLMHERLSRGEGFAVEVINYTKAGRAFWMQVSVQPLREEHGRVRGFFSVSADISARKEAERHLLRAQRLESIGTLAGGLAHDLNNALAPILMGVELLRIEYPQAQDILNTMATSATRGAEMVRRLLTFARGAEGTRRLLRPERLLVEMEKLIRATFPKSIQLDIRYAPNLHPIRGDATQLHQVLLNLCVNARDAMPDGGSLTIEVQNVEVDAASAGDSMDGLAPGAWVMWRVEDTGTGIPAGIIDRIFEPFFTTKPDSGTGFGLAIVQGIVKSHGGMVQVRSAVGQGTTFSLYLPAAQAEPGSDFPAPADDTFRGNGETVLFVDDEAAVRDLACRLLTELNVQVLTAADGTDALVKVAENRGHLRAVITDLHMPHMDGLAFIRLAKRMLPDAGIAVTSGRLDELHAKELAALGVTEVLEKPFTHHDLAATLRSILRTTTDPAV
jgi:PAS domain S-box-containing protein